MSIIELDDPPCRVTLVQNARARRFTLRLDPAGDGAILSFPPGVPERDCRDFLVRHAGWLSRSLARQPKRVAVGHGIELPVAGDPVAVVVTNGRLGEPELTGQTLVLQGAGDEGARVAAWLKARARDQILPAARHYARQLGRRIERISLRDTRSRWGSCSPTGTLNFSWRLAMAPPGVLEYVAAHEAAHLVEMNHSPAFWAEVARIFPDWQQHRDWLKAHGRSLQRYDFTDS